MLSRHITPKISYGVAFQAYDDDKADEIALQIERAYAGSVRAARSRTLTWKLAIGAIRHPAFIRDWEIHSTTVFGLCAVGQSSI